MKTKTEWLAALTALEAAIDDGAEQGEIDALLGLFLELDQCVIWT